MSFQLSFHVSSYLLKHLSQQTSLSTIIPTFILHEFIFPTFILQDFISFKTTELISTNFTFIDPYFHVIWLLVFEDKCIYQILEILNQKTFLVVLKYTR